MDRISIACYRLPNLLFEIIKTSFSRDSSFVLLGNYNTFTEPHMLGESKPDVIILESKKNGESYPDELYQYPKALVICIEQNGKSFIFWRLLPKKKELGTISADKLASIVLSHLKTTH